MHVLARSARQRRQAVAIRDIGRGTASDQESNGVCITLRVISLESQTQRRRLAVGRALVQDSLQGPQKARSTPEEDLDPLLQSEKARKMKP